MIKDKYNSFAEMSRHHRQAEDYRVTPQDRASRVVIIAIHGGMIEPMTSEIARAVAGDDCSLYLFEGLEHTTELHIKSGNFDEPSAIALVQKSQTCISIHGFQEDVKMQICIGGLNVQLREIVFKNLLQTRLIEQKTENPLGRFHGIDKQNIVNRCAEGGVQIEISTALRDLLRDHPDKMAVFASAIRKSITEYNNLSHRSSPQPKGNTP